MHCVLDSSAALAWVLPGEATPATEALLTTIGSLGAVAPGQSPLETAMFFGCPSDGDGSPWPNEPQALAILATLPIQIDARTATQAFGVTSALAAGKNLTVYDACYLEPALRLGLPLASLDKDLCEAALAAG